MQSSLLTKTRRAGLLLAGAIFCATLILGYRSYQYWQSPPVALVEFVGESPIGLKNAIVISGLIMVVVGTYLTRNVYYWSMADPAED